MTRPARVPGACGRRPPKRHPAIPFSAIWTSAVPDYPAAADYLARSDARDQG